LRAAVRVVDPLSEMPAQDTDRQRATINEQWGGALLDEQAPSPEVWRHSRGANIKLEWIQPRLGMNGRMSSKRAALDSRNFTAQIRQILARAIAHAIKSTIERVFTQPGSSPTVVFHRHCRQLIPQ